MAQTIAKRNRRPIQLRAFQPLLAVNVAFAQEGVRLFSATFEFYGGSVFPAVKVAEVAGIAVLSGGATPVSMESVEWASEGDRMLLTTVDDIEPETEFVLVIEPWSPTFRTPQGGYLAPCQRLIVSNPAA